MTRPRMVQGRHEPSCNDRCGYEFFTRWWCPAEQRWTDCPGPCPDGTKHDRTTRQQVWVHHLWAQVTGCIDRRAYLDKHGKAGHPASQEDRSDEG